MGISHRFHWGGSASLPGGRGAVCFPCKGGLTHGLAAVLLLLCASRAISQDLQQSQSPGSIRGTVINAVTGEPISRALVFRTDNRFAMLTASDGHFEYPLPQPVAGIAMELQPQISVCCFRARKPGFIDDPNEEQQGRMTAGSEAVIALLPEGVIKGRIALPSTDAATGMNVEIYAHHVQDGAYRWNRHSETRTNSNGEFRFAELPPGEYRIVTHELMDTDPTTTLGRQVYGYPPVYFAGAQDFTSANVIQLGAGKTFEADLSPVRQPYYPVHIPMAGEAGNVGVTVSIQGHESPGYSLGYRPDRQSIDGFLPNGSYLVSAHSFATDGLGGASGSVIVTVSGGPAQGPKLVLSRHCPIQLNVSEDYTSKDWNQTGRWSVGNRTFEVHGPRLYLEASLESTGDLDFQARSIRPPKGPDDESLVIEDVPPGRYRLRLFASRGYVASASTEGVDLLEEPLVITSGSSRTVDIHLRDDSAQMEGSVARRTNELTEAARSRNDAGFFKPSAWIYFIPQPGSAGQFQQFAADGEGKFGGISLGPGKYLVLAFEKQQRDLPYRDVEAMRAYEAKGQLIRLAAGQKEKLELQVISGRE